MQTCLMAFLTPSPRVDDAGQVPRVEPVRVEVDPGAVDDVGGSVVVRRVRLEGDGRQREPPAHGRHGELAVCPRERRVEVPAVDDPELGEPVRGRGSVARGTAGEHRGHAVVVVVVVVVVVARVGRKEVVVVARVGWIVEWIAASFADVDVVDEVGESPLV